MQFITITQAKHSNNLNLIRLILACLVFFAHFNFLTSMGKENLIFHMSESAVNCFFLVSGMLIWWSYSSGESNFSYFKKRLFRIYPLYMFVIFFQTLIFVFLSNTDLNELSYYFLANILFLNFLAPTVGDLFSNTAINSINGSLWTLKIEVMFYFFVPFLYYIYKRTNVYCLLTLYILSFFWSEAFTESIARQLPGQLKYFLSGIFMYLMLSREMQVKHLLFYVAISLFMSYAFTSDYLDTVFLFFLLFTLAFIIRLPKISFDFSYSIYVLHFPLIQLLLVFGIIQGNLSDLVITAGFLVFLSYLAEKFIEKPFLSFAKKRNTSNINQHL